MGYLTDRVLATGVTVNDLIHIVIPTDLSQGNPAGSSYKATIEQVYDASSAYCFNDIYVKNLHGCSTPITVHDPVQSTGSTSTGTLSFSFGSSNLATGNYSQAFGLQTSATSLSSFSTGRLNLSSGDYSSTNGIGNESFGSGSHAEGSNTISSGVNSHSEGYFTVSKGSFSHSEGEGSKTGDEIPTVVISLVDPEVGKGAHSEGGSTWAFGNYSHTEGVGTYTGEIGSHAEGYETSAMTRFSHSEGQETISSGIASHSEGYLTSSIGDYSHAEGRETLTSGPASHAEGHVTTALADYSHAEGISSQSIGVASHAEGNGSSSIGDTSHAEGNGSNSIGISSHSEGYTTKSFADGSHSEGFRTTAGVKTFIVFSTGPGVIALDASYGDVTGEFTSLDYIITDTGVYSYNNVTFSSTTNTEILLNDNTAIVSVTYVIDYNNYDSLVANSTVGEYSHSEGSGSLSFGATSHAEGESTVSLGIHSHSEGNGTISMSQGSHAEGFFCYNRYDDYSKTPTIGITIDQLSTEYSHAEGGATQTKASWAHSEGVYTSALANASHSEGISTSTKGLGSHSEGFFSQAIGRGSHAEGGFIDDTYTYYTGGTAVGDGSHAEGQETYANGVGSHSEGIYSITNGSYSHADGYWTIADGNYQHVCGMANLTGDTTDGAFIVGNGTDNLNRSNLIFAGGNNVNIYGNLNVSGIVNFSGAGEVMSTTGISVNTLTLTSGITYWGSSYILGNTDLTLFNPTGLDGIKVIIKDEGGIAGTYRIRVNSTSGNIDGTTYVDMNINYMSLTFVARNNNWWII